MSRKRTVYVAGKVGAGTDGVKNLLSQLREIGYEVTYDWTEATGIRKPYLQNKSRNRPFAEKMLRGASECNVAILLYQDEQLGALFEFGMALVSSLTKPKFHAYVVTENVETLRESIFYCLDEVTIIATVEELIALLKD